MKCILSTEHCVYSHDLSCNKVSVDNYDKGQYQHEYYMSQSLKKDYSKISSVQDEETDELKKYESKTITEFKLTQQSSQEYIHVSSNTGGETISSQALDQKTNSSHNLKYASINDYNSSHNLEQNAGQAEEVSLPNLDKLQRKSTNDVKDLNNPAQFIRISSKSKQKSLTVRIPQESLKHIRYNEEEIIEEGSPGSGERKKSSEFNEKDLSRKDSDQRTQQIDRNSKTNDEINSCQNYSTNTPVKPLQQELRQGILLSQQNSQNINKKYPDKLALSLKENSSSFMKQDEMYISFIDVDGVLIIKKILTNPLGIDLQQSFQKAITSFQVDLGITASFCRFIKCTDNQFQNYNQSIQSPQLLSKKQQKKQVKFQQNQKKQQQLNLLTVPSQNTANSDIQQSYDDEEDKSQKDQSQSNQNIQNNENFLVERGDKVVQIREVNLNLIVTNLMGDVIEFKNVPLQGLDNPVAFPPVDNYNSGVTGLCIKSQDTLEIIVSYFDGTVIFFDLNNEDQWNLKLSQPLNSNHFGVYYENTLESDIVFLVSDDAIQIYELNSYHIN